MDKFLNANVNQNQTLLFVSAIYLSLVMGTTGFSVLMTVIMLHLHHQPHDSPVPRWLCRILCLHFNTPRKLHRRETTEIMDHGVKLQTTEFNLSNGTVRQSNGQPKFTSDHWLKYDKKELNQSKIMSQWKEATRRIDQLCFVLFFIIFGILALIMIYPYDRSVSLNNVQCEY